MIERGGQRGAPATGLLPAHGGEQFGDRVVHAGDPGTLAVEAEVVGQGPGGGQRKPQHDQPAGTGEEEQGPLPAGFGQRHPRPDGRGDEQLGPGPGRHGPHRADGPGEQPERGEGQGQRGGAEAFPCVRADGDARGSGQPGYADPGHGGAAAPRPVVDPGEHGSERGHDPEGLPPHEDGHDQQGPGGEHPAHHGVPWDGPPLGPQRVREPGREGCRRNAEERSRHGHGAPVGTRAVAGGMPSGDVGRAVGAVGSLWRVGPLRRIGSPR
ncbi:hypothetical protein GCM10010372_15930 [Streptomyces tauricus]|nr:hypothetical protein GCM10010372_15930 [Streptomyces tauricus]